MRIPLYLYFLGALVVHTEEEWLNLLGPERYHVMRRKGTERSFIGAYVFTEEEGTYLCAACQTPLFYSQDKYRSGSGYPSFKSPISSKNVYYLEDWAFGFKRYEVLCRGCDSHLGHVFHDGPPPNHLRYCINSIALFLQKKS